MDSYYVCCGYDLHLDMSVVAFSLYVRYCGTACVYFFFRWGPFVHSLGIVQWNSTRRDHPGNPGRVSGSGLVTFCVLIDLNNPIHTLRFRLFY